MYFLQLTESLIRAQEDDILREVTVGDLLREAAVERASAVKDIAKRACAYDMPGVIVDGQSVLEVKKTVEAAVKRARKGDGPTLGCVLALGFNGHLRPTEHIELSFCIRLLKDLAHFS